MLSAPMDDLVDGGSGYAVLAHKIADTDMIGVILAPNFTALDRGQTGSFMNGHVEYSKRLADYIQR